MPGLRIVDLRREEPGRRFSELYRNVMEIGAGEAVEAWLQDFPGAMRMALLEQGFKYEIEEAADHWKLRVNGIDFHPLGMGIGIHSIAGEAGSPLLAACDRRDAFYLIDSAGMRLVRQIDVGGTPSHVTVSPAGDRAMIANFEKGTVLSIRFDDALERMQVPERYQGEEQPGRPGEAGILSLPIGAGPHLPQFSGDGRYVCATGSLSGDVAVIDAAGERVLDVLPVGPQPHDPEFTPDGEFALIPVAGAGDVAVVRLGGRPEVVKRLPAGDGPSHLAVSPDGRRLYAANSYSGDVTVLSIASGLDRWRVEATIPSGAGAHVPLLTPDGRTLLVANFLEDTVTLIDTDSGRVRGKVEVGYYPHSFAVTPDGRFAVVACWGACEVYLIDIGAAGLCARIPGGMGASHVAFSADGRQAFVGNSLSDSVSVISLDGLEGIGSIPGGRPLLKKGSLTETYPA